jgi:SOS-response transcriptional repressor LexA
MCSTQGMSAHLPDDAPGLAPNLRRLFEAMRRLSGTEGLSPTHDELADVLGCAKSTVSQWRRQLQDLGLVRFDPEKRRSTRVTTDPAVLAIYGLAPAPDGPVADLARFRSRRARLGGTRAARHPGAHDGEQPWPLAQRTPRRLPLAGAIPAGKARSFAPDEDILEVDSELAGPGQYALRVRGDSLVELGVYDGDVAIVDPEQPAHHGDLVAALLPSEHGDEDLATLKVFELRQGQAWLVAANPVYAPIPIEQAWVLGRVTTIVRRF